MYPRSGLSDTQLHTLTNGQLPTDEVSSSSPTELSDEDSDEEFVYPGTSTEAQATEAPVAETQDTVPLPVVPVQHHPSPAQLESLYAAASSGDLSLLKQLFRNALQTGDVEEFALANDASSRTGQTALHAAARKGFLDIVKWCKFPTCADVILLIYNCQWLKIVVLCLIWRTKKARFVKSNVTCYIYIDYEY